MNKMVTDKSQKKPSELKAGALKSQLTLEIHTLFAIQLWKGRRKTTTSEQTDKQKNQPAKHWMIPSIPHFLSQVSRISDDALNGFLFAEMWLYRLEKILNEGLQKIHSQIQHIENHLKLLPAQIEISAITSTAPINLEIYSRTPLGYKCIWLLVGIDQLALRVLQGYHYGLLSRQQRDKHLNQAGYQIRRALGIALLYRSIPINRDNLDTNSEIYQQAIHYLGEIDPDIITGHKRSSFLQPLKI